MIHARKINIASLILCIIVSIQHPVESDSDNRRTDRETGVVCSGTRSRRLILTGSAVVNISFTFR